jgi:hypothetical protein
MPTYYVCSLPNRGEPGKPRELFTQDQQAIEEFAKQEDKPGRGVFDCVSVLKDGASRRALETVGEVHNIYIDIDFKDIAEDAETVDARLNEIGLRFSRITDSGHGRHIAIALKESIRDPDELKHVDDLRKRLTKYLCGDPSVAHAAALLRRPGTHNTKFGEWIECRTLATTDGAYNLAQIEHFLEAVEGRRLFTPRITNGHDASYDTADDVAGDGPLEIGEALASITCGKDVNRILPRVITKMLGQARDPNEILEHCVGAVMRAVGKYGLKQDDGTPWTHDIEVGWTRKRIVSSINNVFLKDYDYNSGTVPNWLNARYCDRWLEVLQEGRQPTCCFNNAGFFIRTLRYDHHSLNDGEADEVATPAAPIKKLKKNPAVFALPRTQPLNDYSGLEGLPWLMGEHYMRRTVSGTVAPGGTGKSSLSLGECILLAANRRDSLGELPAERVVTWYHSGEEPMEILRLRVAAFCLHHGVPEDEIFPDWSILTTKQEFPFKVAEGYSDLKINDVLLNRMTQQMKERKIGLATFDPLVKMHRIAEQDPAKMDQVASAFQELAEETDAAIDLVHHTRKRPSGYDSDFTADDIRGAGALKDAMRSVRILNQLGEKEIAMIPEPERKRYFRVSMVKANYSLRARDTCYRLATVQIPNKQLTEVGAVELWMPPRHDSGEAILARQQAEDTFMLILRRAALRGQPIFSDRKGINYAPKIMAAEPEARAAQVSAKALEQAMSALFRKGKIMVVDETTHGHRTHKIILVPPQPEGE